MTAIPERTQSTEKAAAEVIDCGWDWAPWLDGDSISFATHDATGCTVSADAVEGTKTLYRVSGGTPGGTATVLTTMTTVGGEKAQAELQIRIMP